MPTVININIDGQGVSQPITPFDPEPYCSYPLLPGFSPIRDRDGFRKIKTKKKKKCTNGQVCGFSCISKSKTCTANMTTAQFKEHNEAKRAERREKVAIINDYEVITKKYGKLTKDEKEAAKSHVDGFNSSFDKGKMGDAMKKYWLTRREFGYAEEQVDQWKNANMDDEWNKNVYETGMRRARVYGTATMAIEEKLMKEGKTKDELDAIYDNNGKLTTPEPTPTPED